MIDLEEVRLTVDERESIRLSDFLGMSHEEAGRYMGVSRATFGRIVQRARKVIADALINGKAVNIEGGSYKLIGEKQIFLCKKCNNKWVVNTCAGRSRKCPSCNHENDSHILENE